MAPRTRTLIIIALVSLAAAAGLTALLAVMARDGGAKVRKARAEPRAQDAELYPMNFAGSEPSGPRPAKTKPIGMPAPNLPAPAPGRFEDIEFNASPLF